MEPQPSKIYSVLLGVILGGSAALLLFTYMPAAAPRAGSASDNHLDALTKSLKYVLTTDTTVSATNTARTYLEISNISAATATANASAIWCNAYNDLAATLYQGFMIAPSSTKVFNLDNIPRAAVHCLSASSVAAVSVMEQ